MKSVCVRVLEQRLKYAQQFCRSQQLIAHSCISLHHSVLLQALVMALVQPAGISWPDSRLSYATQK